MRVFLVLSLLAIIGCGPRSRIVPYRHKEESRYYRMRLDERNRYETIRNDMKNQYDQAKASGEEEAVFLTRICESFDQRMVGLQDEPHPALISARALLEKDKMRICGAAEKARKRLESKQRHQQRMAELEKKREEMRKEREAEEEAEQRKDMERKAALQSTIITRAGIQVQVIDAANVGDDLGINATPAGTYVVVLIKATNLNRKSVFITADDFWLMDEKGRVYGIDVEGSLEYAMTDPESHHKIALGQQLHPDVETYVACVFDVPEETPRTLKLGFVFKDKKGLFHLYLKDEGRPSVEYDGF